MYVAFQLVLPLLVLSAMIFAILRAAGNVRILMIVGSVMYALGIGTSTYLTSQAFNRTTGYMPNYFFISFAGVFSTVGLFVFILSAGFGRPGAAGPQRRSFPTVDPRSNQQYGYGPGHPYSEQPQQYGNPHDPYGMQR